MVNRKLFLALCTAAVLAVVLAPHVNALANVQKTTYMTFSQPVRLPGVALASGTYIFEIANPSSGADIVRVMSSDRSRSYFMGFTRAIARPHTLPREQVVSLGEAARGTPPPVTAWWPTDESTGRLFVYPRAH
jgi:hypothetical protein